MKEKLHDMFYGASWIIHKQAKELRNRETKAEKILWSFLSNKKMGVKFRRQHPINQFIADFYCHELKLVLEVDGPIHFQEENMEYDRMRTKIFHSYGLKVLRFTNEQVIHNSESGLSTIKKFINDPIPKYSEEDL